MSISVYISFGGLLVAVVALIYAHLQARSAKTSVLKAEKAIEQALEQNRNGALIILKNHYEGELPRIKEMADHFAHPDTIRQRESLDKEYQETQQRLHRVNDEIRGLYEHYVLSNKSS